MVVEKDRPRIVTLDLVAGESIPALQRSTDLDPWQMPLTAEEWFSLVDELADWQVPRVHLRIDHADGLHADLLAYSAHRLQQVSLELPPCSADPSSLLVIARRCGVREVVVDLHSAEEQVHELMTDSASWKRMVEMIRSAGDLEVVARTRVLSANASGLPRLGFLLSDLGVQGWWIDFLPRHSSQDTLDAPAAIAALRFLYAEAVSRDLFLIVEEAPAAREALTDQLRAGGVIPDLRRVLRIDASRTLRITRAGQIVPGPSCRVRIGNVREHTIASRFNYSPVYEKLRTHRSEGKGCDQCEYLPLCHAGHSNGDATTLPLERSIMHPSAQANEYGIR